MEASRTTRHTHTRGLRLNRRVVTFLICLALSSLGWTLISLSQDYLERQQFHVTYSGLPLEVLSNSLPDTILVEYNATGFNMLFRDPSGKDIQLDCSSTSVSGSGKYNFLPASSIAKQFNKRFGAEFRIQRVLPDTIRLVLAGSNAKRVPVEFAGRIKYKGNLFLIDSVAIDPSTVLLVGDTSAYAAVEVVKTTALNWAALEGKNTFKLPLSLDGMPLESIPDSVTIRFTTEKFTEREFIVPVTITGLPKGYAFRPVPKEVKVKCMVPFSMLKDAGSISFTAVVDYSEMDGKQSNKAHLHIRSGSGRLKQIRSFPESVDFILRKSM